MSILHQSITRVTDQSIAIVLLMTFVVSGVSAQDTPGANEIQAENCMVGYINKVEIPAESQGKLNAIKIEEGMTVKKDALIATVDDTQAKLNQEKLKAEEEEAILNATNDVNLRDAKNSEEIARAEAESYKDLHKEGATPYWEMKKKIMEAERAKLRIELAEQQAKIAKVQYFGKRAELRMAEDEIQRRQIKAPFDGFIENRIANLGQWFNLAVRLRHWCRWTN